MAKLSELLNNYQTTGKITSSEVNPIRISKSGFSGGAPVDVDENGNPIRQWKSSTGLGPMGEAITIGQPRIENDYAPISHAREAAEAGWGDSRYDIQTGFVPGADIEDVRAKAQPWYWKIGNGIMKGGVTAATTAANTVGGTIIGAGSSMFELGREIFSGDGISGMKVLDAGVNNFLSENLMKLQTLAEDIFPNYRTAEERSEKYQKEWWKHIGTANFIGDSFLKNLGFTVGAIYGGSVWTNLIGKSMAKKLASDIMKNAVVAANGDAEAVAILKNTADALRSGAISTIDTSKLVGNMKNVAKAINKMESKLQLYGAVLGAMGEGTTEGIMAKNEFLDEYMSAISDAYSQKVQHVDEDLMNSPYSSGYWVSDGVNKYLSAKGQEESERRKRRYLDDLIEQQRMAEAEGDRLSSATFLLNIPILTTSNTIQFGKMFSGGWKTARKNMAIGGSTIMKKAVGEAGKYANPILEATYSAEGNIARNTILGSLKVGGTEAFEEMAQGAVSSGQKRVAAKNLAEYNNTGYDPKSVHSFGNWLAGMIEGGSEYLGDSKNWQEGFIGAVTGLLGLPTLRNGRVGWQGGIIGENMQAREEYNEAKRAADKLNELVNSEDFQNRWHSYIRHIKYDNDMEEAVQRDDEYAWHNANDNMLISDIIAFDDAGKLNDLLDIVKSYGEISEADAAGLVEVMDDEDGKKSPSEIVSEVRERAKDYEKRINEYKDVYDALASRARPGTSSALLKEMVFTAEEIKMLEDRFLDMLDKTIGVASSKFTKDDSDIEHLREFQANLARFFTSTVVPGRLTESEQKAASEAIMKLRSMIVGDEEASKQVADMLKLAVDRDLFYDKLQHLETIQGAHDFEEQMITQQKQVEEANRRAMETEINGYDSLASVRDAYFKITGKDTTRRRLEFVDHLRAAKGRNKAVDSFVELHDAVEGFRTKARSVMSSFVGSHQKPFLAEDVYHLMLRDLLDNVDSVEELERLDPSAFASVNEITDSIVKASRGSFKYPFPPNASDVAEAMAEVQEHLRDVMEEYVKEVKSAEYVRSKKKIGSAKKHTPSTEPIPAGVPGPFGSAPEAPAAPAAPPASAPRTEISGEQARTEKEESEERGGGVAAGKTEIEDLEREQAGKPVDPKEKKASSETTNGKKRYYRASIPELALDRLISRRNIYVNISDPVERSKELAKAASSLVHKVGDDYEIIGFGEDDERFSEVYQGLKDRNAFNNMSLVRKNDKILFVRYRSEDAKAGGFPKIDGEYVTLMCVEKTIGGKKELLVLNILGKDTERTKYYGLEALHKAIQEEFEAKGFDDDGKFVFSKQSTVWSLQSGIVPYGPTYYDRSIASIEGYSEDCPIVLVGSDGSLIPLRGEVKISPDKIFGDGDNTSARKGHIYYLAYGTDGYTVPIRLNQEHFNKKTIEQGKASSAVARVREIVREIVTIAKNAENEVPKFQEIEGEKYEDRSERLRKYNKTLDGYRSQLDERMRELGRILDLHRDIVTLGVNSQDGLMSLKITPEYKVAAKEESGVKGAKAKMSPMYFSGTTLTEDAFIEGLASLDRAFNISKSMSEAEIDAKIKSGILTSNAVAMRPVGIDFYIYPFVPGSGKGGSFKAGSKIQEDVKKGESAEEKKLDSPATGSSPEAKAMTPEEILNSRTKTKPKQFQVVGARPSALSQEERVKLAEERRANHARSSKIKSELYRQLQNANGITNMKMSDKKLKEKLLRLGLARPVVDFLLKGLEKYPSLRNMTPYEAFVQLDSLMRYDLAQEYNRSIGEKLDRELNDYLVSFLSRFGISVERGDLEEMFGVEGVAGAYDVIEKVIWLADNPDKINKMTMPEEFAHAFVELMGSSLGYGADSADFQFLYETVVHTKIYEQVYAKYKHIYLDENGRPDEYLIRKEAIGQALAAGITHNWDERKLGKTEESKSFWNQLKEWFQKILDLFRGQNISFEQTIDDIAKEIIDGDIRRLVKVDDSGYNLLDYEKTIADQNEKDGGKAVEFMRYFSSIGNLITGSLAYRRQGTVYRSKMDSLHDIDMIVPAEAHGIHNVELLSKYNFQTRNNPDFINDVLSTPYFRKIAAKYPKIVFANVYNNGHYITVNAVYSEDESLSKRFASMTGSYADRLEQFTPEERSQIYLFDFFLRTPEDSVTSEDVERGLTFVDYKTPFREKLRMGRAKDIYDYQRWRLFDAFSERRPDPRDVMFQSTSPDYGKRALDKHYHEVFDEIRGSSQISERDSELVATAMTILASKGPVRMEQVETAIHGWTTSGISYSQDVSDFRLVFDSIFTPTEKDDIGEAIESAYGVSPDKVNAFVLMNDYVMWKLSGIITRGTVDDRAILGRAFERLLAVEENRDAVLGSYDRVADIVGEKSNLRNDWNRIGTVPDVSVFANLTETTKESLMARGWTEEQYDSAPEDIQDKALRCAGV